MTNCLNSASTLLQENALNALSATLKGFIVRITLCRGCVDLCDGDVLNPCLLCHSKEFVSCSSLILLLFVLFFFYILLIHGCIDYPAASSCSREFPDLTKAIIDIIKKSSADLQFLGLRSLRLMCFGGMFKIWYFDFLQVDRVFSFLNFILFSPVFLPIISICFFLYMIRCQGKIVSSTIFPSKDFLTY